MQAGQMAYDRAITVFSPDGRLFQVEYARVAVTRGTTTIGITFKDGVVLIADKRLNSRLIDPDSVEKICEIDEHIGVTCSGLVADARIIIDYARVQSQINKVTYDEPILVSALAKKVCDYKQQYTQYGGVRPFGIALLIAGVDNDGPKLYETDPSGALFGYMATSIGAGKEAVMEMLEEEWKEGMKKEDAIALGLKALQKANEEPLNSISVEMGVIQKGKKFQKYSTKDVEKLIKKVLGAQVKGD